MGSQSFLLKYAYRDILRIEEAKLQSAASEMLILLTNS